VKHDIIILCGFQVLNDCGVDSAGDEESLKKTCSGVIEIDLAHNQLTQWSEVSFILSV